MWPVAAKFGQVFWSERVHSKLNPEDNSIERGADPIPPETKARCPQALENLSFLRCIADALGQSLRNFRTLQLCRPFNAPKKYGSSFPCARRGLKDCAAPEDAVDRYIAVAEIRKLVNDAPIAEQGLHS